MTRPARPGTSLTPESSTAMVWPAPRPRSDAPSSSRTFSMPVLPTCGSDAPSRTTGVSETLARAPGCDEDGLWPPAANGSAANRGNASATDAISARALPPPQLVFDEPPQLVFDEPPQLVFDEPPQLVL